MTPHERHSSLTARDLECISRKSHRWRLVSHAEPWQAIGNGLYLNADASPRLPVTRIYTLTPPGKTLRRTTSDRLRMLAWSRIETPRHGAKLPLATPLATPLNWKYRLTCSPAWTRTRNRPINSRMLCQLSYRGLPGTRWLCREPRHDSSLRAGVKAKPDGPPTSDKEGWHCALSLRAGQM